MDWIRRNWPDLLMAVALLAVIVGIIATLLNGGVFFGGTPAPNATVEPPTTNAAPLTPEVDTAVSPPVASATLEDSAQTAADAAEDVAQAAAEGAGAVTDAVREDVTPVVPGEAGTSGADVGAAPGDSALSDTTFGDEPSSDEVTRSELPSNETSETALTDTSNAALGGDAPDTAPSGGGLAGAAPEGAFRILVGSYRDAANAERQAESFNAQGFPTFTAQQDDLSLALVGPFAERSEAEAALSSLQSSGLVTDPQLFELTEDTAEVAAPEANSPDVATSDAVNTGAADVTDNLASASGTTVQAADIAGEAYIQTGAYGSSEAAKPQRDRLESLGFSVTELAEGSFIKLLVGPFETDELSAAQDRLSAQGLEFFVRGN